MRKSAKRAKRDWKRQKTRRGQKAKRSFRRSAKREKSVWTRRKKRMRKSFKGKRIRLKKKPRDRKTLRSARGCLQASSRTENGFQTDFQSRPTISIYRKASGLRLQICFQKSTCSLRNPRRLRKRPARGQDAGWRWTSLRRVLLRLQKRTEAAASNMTDTYLKSWNLLRKSSLADL